MVRACVHPRWARGREKEGSMKTGFKVAAGVLFAIAPLPVGVWQPNLTTWTTTAMQPGLGPIGLSRYPVAFVNNIFLAPGTATGASSTLSEETSPDGLNWTGGILVNFSTTTGMSSPTNWLATA